MAERIAKVKVLPGEEESEEIIVKAIYFTPVHQLVNQKVKPWSKDNSAELCTYDNTFFELVILFI